MFIISNISNCIPMGNWHSLDKRKRNEEEEENHKKKLDDRNAPKKEQFPLIGSTFN